MAPNLRWRWVSLRGYKIFDLPCVLSEVEILIANEVPFLQLEQNLCATRKYSLIECLEQVRLYLLVTVLYNFFSDRNFNSMLYSLLSDELDWARLQEGFSTECNFELARLEQLVVLCDLFDIVCLATVKVERSHHSNSSGSWTYLLIQVAWLFLQVHELDDGQLVFIIQCARSARSVLVIVRGVCYHTPWTM